MNVLVSFLFLYLSTLATAQDTTSMPWHKAQLLIQSPKSVEAGKPTEIIVVIKNKIDKEWTGYVSLELKDEQRKQNVDGLFANVFPSQYFTVSAGDSAVIEFPITVPHQPGRFIIAFARLYDEQKRRDSAFIKLSFKQ